MVRYLKLDPDHHYKIAALISKVVERGGRGKEGRMELAVFDKEL